MPCYLFTYHAYGSWLPDRPRGYVRRGKGVLPPDRHMARLYRRDMVEQPIEFAEREQRCLIDSLVASADKQAFELHAVGTDASHLHVLLAWRNDRAAVKLRAVVKGSLSRALNAMILPRTWLSEGGSRKQVRDRRHFDYLIEVYLPKHDGWNWNRTRGFFRRVA